jgi:peptide-methionine (S)-S-oxide reductase
VSCANSSATQISALGLPFSRHRDVDRDISDQRRLQINGGHTMFRNLVQRVAPIAVLLGTAANAPRAEVPSPHHAALAPVSKNDQVVVLSGGCFWGVQAVFQHVQGVTSAVSGYAGGDATSAHYDRVSDGNTGHAESVRVTFDPAQVTYEQLLHVFFAIAHDPTQLNYQGPDHGTQYRSVIYFHSPEQEKTARELIRELDAGKIWDSPIVTEVVPLTQFYAAEDYHQGYFAQNPEQGYCQAVISPKMAKLRKHFADRMKS